MAFRDDISFNFEESPRVATVAAPSVELSVQDMHDTFTDIEDSILGHQFDNLILSAGKEDLGGGTLVTITSELQNAQVTFEDRSTVLDTASVTTPDATGTTLTDSASTFITDTVERGDLLVNSTDGSHATVLDIVSETVLQTQPLRGGIDNQYDTSDVINIFKIHICTISGGNTVAVDDVGAEMEPLLQSFGTWAKIASASSGTLQEQSLIEFASFGGVISVDPNSTHTLTNQPLAGNKEFPVNNLIDAAAQSVAKGLDVYSILASLTLSNEADWTGHTFIGRSVIDTVITVGVLANVTDCVFTRCSLEGDLGATTEITECFLGETNPLTNVRGVITRCSIGPSPLTLGGGPADGGTVDDQVRMNDCRAAGLAFSPPTINGNGDGPQLVIQGHIGTITVGDKTGEAPWKITCNSDITVNSTCTNGVIELFINGSVDDLSGPNCTVIPKVIDGSQINELWQLQGLEIGNPMTVNKTQRFVQDQTISMALTGDGETTTTVTRQTDQTLVFDAPLTADLLDDSDTGATPTFSRASTGTYISSVDGLRTSAAIDTPRFELDGLLIEEERENICLRSNELDVSPWSVYPSGSTTRTADQGVGADGLTTLDQIESAGAGVIQHWVRQILSGTGTSGVQFIASVDLKKDSGEGYAVVGEVGDSAFHSVSFNLNDGTVHDTAGVDDTFVEDLGGGLYRCSVVWTRNTNNDLWFVVGPVISSVSNPHSTWDVAVHGTQSIFAGAADLSIGRVPTSYIPTTTVAVTRNADFLSYNNDAIISDTEGTTICDLTVRFDANAPNPANIVNCTNTQAGPLYIDDDTTEKIAINDGTLTGSYDPTLVANTTYTIASRWGGSTMQTVVAGGTGSTSSYDGSFVRTVGTLYVGSTSTANHINGNIKYLKIYNVDRGEDQLKVDTG